MCAILHVLIRTDSTLDRYDPSLLRVYYTKPPIESTSARTFFPTPISSPQTTASSSYTSSTASSSRRPSRDYCMEFDSPASSSTALPSDDSIFSSPVSVASTLSTSSSQDLTIGPSSQATFGARQLATFTSSTGATVLEPTLEQLVSSFAA